MEHINKKIELTSRNYKTWKTFYKYNLIKSFLLKNTVLFFYYDFINSADESTLKLILKENNLKLIKIKKNSILNLLSHTKYNSLKNIFKNNTCIIINLNENNLEVNENNNIFLNKDFILKFSKIKSIHFTGIRLKSKFYRPSEYKKVLSIKDVIKKDTVILIKQSINLIKNYLTFKKI